MRKVCATFAAVPLVGSCLQLHNSQGRQGDAVRAYIVRKYGAGVLHTVSYVLNCTGRWRLAGGLLG